MAIFILMKQFLLSIVLAIVVTICFAQGDQRTNWYNPLNAGIPVIEGRLWQSGLDQPYDRLPAHAIPVVRKEVMNLARNSAGTYIRFTTRSNSITVRYQVAGGLQFPHMPATGVSGVDLYAIDQKGNWHWIRGKYSFSDTIRYNFSPVDSTIQLKEFRLYLPLYNTVKWMELGVPEKHSLQWIAATNEAQIVLYGTSILQGACASRAGLAWTNILGRKISQPLVNLGFSGNGRMEKELIDLIAEKPAKLVVLDCMPNLSNLATYPKEELLKRYRYAVEKLRAGNPKLPILLVEHCCGLPGSNLDSEQRAAYQQASETITSIYQQLQKEGYQQLYLLTAPTINFDQESTVDGTHPNDIGMMKYAEAYEQLIGRIFSLTK